MRDGTAEPVSRDRILRHARGQGNTRFPCSADHEQDWQPCPVDPYSAICDDHTYSIIVTSRWTKSCHPTFHFPKTSVLVKTFQRFFPSPALSKSITSTFFGEIFPKRRNLLRRRGRFLLLLKNFHALIRESKLGRSSC